MTVLHWVNYALCPLPPSPFLIIRGLVTGQVQGPVVPIIGP